MTEVQIMKVNKAKLNYAVDILISIGVTISLISGILLLFNQGNGYLGGRNPHFSSTVLFFPQYAWKDIHNWSSIIMASGVLIHLVLHWNWMVCMTRKILGKEQKQVRCAILE